MNPIYAGLLLAALLGLLWLAYWLGAREAREVAERKGIERFNRRMSAVVQNSLMRKRWLAEELENLAGLPKHARIRAGVKRVAEELRDEIKEAGEEEAYPLYQAGLDGIERVGPCQNAGCEG